MYIKNTTGLINITWEKEDVKAWGTLVEKKYLFWAGS